MPSICPASRTSQKYDRGSADRATQQERCGDCAAVVIGVRPVVIVTVVMVSGDKTTRKLVSAQSMTRENTLWRLATLLKSIKLDAAGN